LPQPHLKKIELSEEKVHKILASKPGDINIILARTVSIITGNEPEKTKKQLIDEILEVLERSEASRLFVGMGIKEEYHVFKGFPVRSGEKFQDLPDQGTEIKLDKGGFYQSWTTDPVDAREISTTYDPLKGDPVGGLLVDAHITDQKLFFDVNAMIRSCKMNFDNIRAYNNIAAQGKAISSKNVDVLATEVQKYTGIYEILSDPNVVHVRVVDKWTWAKSNGENIPQWQTKKGREPKEEVSGEISEPSTKNRQTDLGVENGQP